MKSVTLTLDGVDSLTLAGDSVATPDVNDNVRWAFAELTGWDSPEVRTALVDQPATDGSYAGDFYFGPRILSLSGGFVAATPDDISLARERLALLTARMRGDVFTEIEVQEEIPRRLKVRRSGPLKMRTVANGYACEFELGLVAPDPRKLGTTNVFSLDAGTGQLFSTGGNYDTSPTIHINSPGFGTSFRIEYINGAGTLVALELNIPGSVLEVDINMALRTVKSFQTTVRGSIVAGTDFWDISPASNNDWRFFSDDAGANAVMTVCDAWI